MAQVLGKGLTEFSELSIRVTVQSSSGSSNSLGNGGLHISRDAMSVLVDIEQDGDIKLRRAIGAQSTQVGPEGKSVKSLKLVTHQPSLRGGRDCRLTVTPGHRCNRPGTT
ncbi:hypothetical protein AAU01_24750 [Paenarthrobacter aurescens]|uniref:Uncharacterized protein n=1 Tax=Paenarthrobacter aurescens TaxID=43663 RepID=A0A4Y3ND24_PAEAU|nr:hypothetical protein AAU01_24750 [Paenarthrobacter aurescens]